MNTVPPSSTNNVIQQYITETEKILLQNRDAINRNNLSRKQRTILNKLQHRTDIVIKKSDKGDKITVETTEHYIQDGLNHLSDTNIYHRVEEDMNPVIHQTIQKFLDHSLDRGLINEDIHQFLTKQQNPRTPIIYFLKKLHKTPVKVRPIVSNINSPTSQLSVFMNILLKPLVAEHPQILKNSTEIVREMEQITLSEQSLLVTADVCSLYPSIPIEESINITDMIEQYNNPTYPPVIIIKSLLEYILYCNCFTFVDFFFLQVCGVAMGTPMAPNFANLFMANFEEKHILTFSSKPTFYKRYIDDIILIFDHPLSKLEELQQHLNDVHPTIKFTFEHSYSTVNYLDITIEARNNRCYIKPYFKSTNTFSYVMGDSYHPKSTFKNILIGENNRILRNCSTETDYIETMDMLRSKFSQRNFPLDVLQLSNILYTERVGKLVGSQSSITDPMLTIITEYQKGFRWLDILQENWGIFSKDDLCRRILLPTPVRVCRTNHKSLTKRLVKAKVEGVETSTLIDTYPIPKLPSKSFPAKNISCRNTQCATCLPHTTIALMITSILTYLALPTAV